MQETAEHYTVRDGVRLAYWRSRAQTEDASTLLLLHGAASNHTRWSEMLDRSDLREHFHVLRPDLRGNGASMARGKLDAAVWSDDLVELLHEERVERAVVVGHSLGAQIAMHFGARVSAQTRALVLIDPVFQAALQGRKRHLARLGFLWTPVVWVGRALNALGLSRKTYPELDLQVLDRETREIMKSGEGREELVKRYGSFRKVTRHLPIANYIQEMRETVGRVPPLESITVPVLVLLSRGISFANADVQRREIERFSDARVVEIDASHWPLTERPDEVRAEIESWLLSLRDASA